MPGKTAEGTALRAVASSQSPSEIHMVVAPGGARTPECGGRRPGTEQARGRGSGSGSPRGRYSISSTGTLAEYAYSSNF